MTPSLHLLASIQNIDNIAVILVAGVVAIASFTLFRPSYSGISPSRSVLAFAATWLFLMGFVIYLASPLSNGLERSGIDPDAQLVFALKLGGLLVFAVPFVLRLYSKWIGGKSTPAELAAGAVGIRAWLSPINCVVAMAVAVMAWLTFDISLVLMLMLTFGLLLAAPALRVAPTADSPAEPTRDERGKVLSLLESGRITAEESAELLNALAASQRFDKPAPQPLSPARRLMVIGSCMVLTGFFFPWFSISPADEMARAFKGMHDVFPAGMGTMNLSVPGFPAGGSGFRVAIHAAQVQQGMGWLVLACAAAAVLLPVFARSMDRSTLRLLQMLALGIGSVILLSLLGSGLRHVSFGFVITLAGYVVAWLGLLREAAPLRAPGRNESVA